MPRQQHRPTPDAAAAAGLKHEVVGLDCEAGLAHMPGVGAPFYLSMLRMFVKTHEPTVDRLRLALANGDLVEVRMLAHSLRGTAATLGAKELSSLATEVEEACDNARPQAEIELLAGQLASKLTDLRVGLASALPQALDAG
jgi:two-component system, sensor histidine kinase and response regulator